MSFIDRARGLTLIELVIFIVVVAAAVAGVMAVFVQGTRGSGDPLVRKQAMAVAESLLEEIMAVPYTCPSGATCNPVTASNRGQTHALADYNGFAMSGIAAVDGTAIPQLAAYNSLVTVAPAPLNGANGSQITITVTAGAESIGLEGWRGNF